MTEFDRRFIEETFPVKAVSEHSRREKSIRHGHISTLHIWWARRPLAASRATAYAALTPPPQDALAWQTRSEFIAHLSRWENSLNPALLERARREIYEAHAQRLSAELGTLVTAADIEAGKYPPPRVLDPFAGGGSYPLEALRLGCEAYANDYNPVAVLILKATLEYPQKFGCPFAGMPILPGREKNPQAENYTLFDLEKTAGEQPVNPLLEAVRYWGNWVLEEARKELAPFYPPDPDGKTPVGYIWARTLPCQNPSCGVEIPLMRQFWLAKKDQKQIALRPLSAGSGKAVRFELVARGKKSGGNYRPWPEGFDPEKGTVSRAVVTCPACGAVMDDKTTRRLFQEGRSGQRLVAVVLAPAGEKATSEETSGKTYRLAAEADLNAYRAAETALQSKVEALRAAWGMQPVPDEPTPEGKGSGAERAFAVRNYGLNTWGDLFNPRQALALLTFANGVRRAHAAMLAQGYPEEFARAVGLYLALIFDKFIVRNTNISVWHRVSEGVEKIFALQVLPMQWEYAESNSLGDHTVAGFSESTRMILDIIVNLSCAFPYKKVEIFQKSATHLPYPEGYFDAVLTDPPYYDNVPYSYLSDFFYVWLKRTLGHLYPDLFATPLTPKSEEIVAYSSGEGGLEGGFRFFEEHLSRAFREIHRVLKPGGTAVIVYAHKSTAGWETVINALLDSGLVVSAAWPLNTEMESRLRASESAALASSIYIVARKAARLPVGFYGEVRQEMRQYLEGKLTRLWEEGIGGADFFIAAIGAAIEVFGKYEQVIDLEGSVIRADALLDEVRHIATDFAVRQILHNGFAAEVSDRTRFYVLWRWNYGEARVPFDEARKLAQSCGLDLSEEWSRRGSMVKKEQEFIRLLGPHQRKMEHLAAGGELVDVLHHALLLWEKNDRNALIQRLAQSGFGGSEVFYRVAQAVSECLPIESKEKKLLDGLLTGRPRLQEEVRQLRML